MPRQKDGQKDGRAKGWKGKRTDRRTDRPYFIGLIWLLLGIKQKENGVNKTSARTTKTSSSKNCQTEIERNVF